MNRTYLPHPDIQQDETTGTLYRVITQKVLDRRTGLPIDKSTMKPIEVLPDDDEPDTDRYLTKEVRREVSLDFEDARKRRVDFYKPGVGWIIEGYKLQVDRTVEQLMADSSTPIAKIPEHRS